MSHEPYPGDRPDERGREETEPQGETPLDGGFKPTDLAKLFGSGEGEAFLIQRQSVNGEDPQWLAERQAEMENLTPKKLYEKECKVAAVYEQTSPAGGRAYFVQLRDNAGRDLKVWVDFSQATSISLATEGANIKRPLTHDLMKTLVERLGWKVDRILIDDLYNDTFYAKLSLVKDKMTEDIDCRPSDAIALALRTHAPIYVAEDVLAAANREDAPPEEDDSQG